MKESGKRIAAVLLVFMIAMAAFPLTASAAAGEYMKVTRNGGQPSGNYTFVISNSANNKAITKTLWLNIPQGGNG